MRKLYFFILTLALTIASVGVDAQNTGFNRLQNVATGHVTNLSGGARFAPDVTLEESYSKPGTVAYTDFDGQKVTQLRAQGVDVVNTLVPMIKVMITLTIDEGTFSALKDSAIVRVNDVMGGSMGTLLVNYIKNYSYADFQQYVLDSDMNLYYTAVEGGYELYFNSPAFPINAGDFTQYFMNKTNSYISLYRGTLQEYVKPYLVGREYLTPTVNSLIKHIMFGDYLYLCEAEDETYGPCLVFANSNDKESTSNLVWDFIPVDETNYLGLQGKCQDADGNWWGALSFGFPFRLSDGMKAYYVDSEVDYSKSLIHRVAVTDDVIPAMTPVILQLNGEDAASNRLSLVDDDTTQPYADNALSLPLDSLGFMVGFTLDEPNNHYCTLGVTDGKVSLKVTDQTFFGPNEPYYYLSDDLVTLVKSGSLALADEVSGIGQLTATQNKDNAVYDLQGRRVENPTKGIYIVNGKKVLLR